MAQEVTLPRLNESMEEAKIVNWLKEEGQLVKRGESLLEVETNKATIEMESPCEGHLLKIIKGTGSEVPIGITLAIIGEKDEKLEIVGKPEGNKATDNLAKYEYQRNTSSVGIDKGRSVDVQVEKVFASPLAKKIAKENGINLSKVKGSSANGRIVKEDILKYIQSMSKSKSFGVERDTQDEVYTFSGRRKIIASRMEESWTKIPHFVLNQEVVADEILKLKDEFLRIENIKISITVIITKAVIKALESYPALNAHVEGDSLRIMKEKNIGIAMADEKGILVPVIKSAQKLSMSQISNRISELIKKVKENSVSNEDLECGTFTITNLGMYGIRSFSAIINPPEVGILAVGSLRESYMQWCGESKFLPVIDLSLSLDHRAVDGELGAKFLAEVKKFLENPNLML